MQRRQFLQSLALLGLFPERLPAFSSLPREYYQNPKFGNVTLLHYTDCHAQLLPVYYREPSSNVGVGQEYNLPPHISGQEFLKFFGVKANSKQAYAFTHLNFTQATAEFGKMGGFAYLATMINHIREERGKDNTLLLDGGDSWQGSATALLSKGQDMVEASNRLGTDVMTGHWEFTYGENQVKKNLRGFKGEFVAQNIALTEEAQFESNIDHGDVFKPYTIKTLKHARIAIIGQAFPYTPIAHPRRFTPHWRFGIEERNLQDIVNEIRQEKKADAVILLSHNGMDVDLKLASRITGIDAILGGHTHDAIPKPIIISNGSGKTIVTNAGSHGKFLGVLDLDVKPGRVVDFSYRLVPVFSNLIEPDENMQHLIHAIRQPLLTKLQQPLATTEELLFRRDNFYGSFDQVVLDALRKVNDVQITLSPGFRWGPTLLPGNTITMEDVMAQTAITYPETYVRNISGGELKNILEDVCDNLFNKDPYFRQGGDMVRVGGMSFTCRPEAKIGFRISVMRLANGDIIDSTKDYKISSWASVGVPATGKPVWEVIAEYLKDKKVIKLEKINQPKVLLRG